MKYTIQQVAEQIGGELINFTSTNNLHISGLNYANLAKNGDLTLINKSEHIKLWQDSKASAAIISKDLREAIKETNNNRPLILVNNADLAMAKALELFSKPNPEQNGIHEKAVVEPTATIGANVSIGSGVYIGKNVVIGDNTTIYANVSIYDETTIGQNCIIWPNVTIRERTQIGHFCRLYSNCSIGSDGFGYRPSEDGKSIIRVPHIGNVIIGNYVDIGSSTCIDIAKFGSTIIGDFTKIDNLVQIGHNVTIGKGCMICGQAGISGSVTIGDGVIIAGNAGIKDHTKIGAGARIGAKSGVMKDVPAGQSQMGYPAYEGRELMRQWVAIKQLPDTMKKLKALAKSLNIDL
ncbi:UDP-3-O-(3-hydroxymyristoyl)glucosamine N-acyltransferase [Allofrancisella guangzhouensis]|uniref:UDP-3-O-acylglucosamine N-acyltransferase n=1 Tax=Allofrancisella guangzhouensis TaxID=594679 RepID=A0A0A8E3E8_9GAMM|nr:UDP-3-O-(3-hydroxymyristoyl)glucosamine N-acyltransferase [Allofrancisella guangzhouensis]AJC48518.1 UDP-3-O-(3-hydroxymyristoyl) glucosamine N-acyltransferase [Allofrancisella guangzhouensis]MBK2027823.1 UDP-3-O-(3-hydroxymyristoyl)glucosamine N-acyltransferase [Allofrancisella guangzhouensis]MBK2044813.1 UDP-3-O-(3-hydroxymyristoyl)glucosamine N-acyltransferase [Allofrancisella guangzhouensis]MBK2045735.1 UDP-3-O-(3-hydroxymyristoyl)glucosamine N-acyltransferase [Allofrancisella guangzhoue